MLPFGILFGAENAATEYLRRTTYVELKSAFYSQSENVARKTFGSQCVDTENMEYPQLGI